MVRPVRDGDAPPTPTAPPTPQALASLFGAARACAPACGRALALALLGVGTRALLTPWLGDELPFATLYAAVAVAAWADGYRGALLTAVLGYVGCDWLVAHGVLTGGGGAQPVVELGLYGLSCAVIVGLAEGTRRGEEDGQVRRLADSLPVPVWVDDAQQRSVFLNRPFTRLVGGPAAAARLGADWQALLHPDEAPAFRERYAAARRQRQEHRMAVRLRGADGAYRHFEVVAVPRLVRGRFAGYLGVCVDITERAAAEERLATVLASIGDHLVSYDREWRYTYVNEQGARLLGKTPAELLGRSIWEVFPEAIGNQYWRELHDAVRTGRVLRSAHYYAPFDRWFENHIYPRADGVTVFSSDITARVRAEHQARAAEEMLRLITDHVPALISYIDKDYRYRLNNHAYESWFGVTREAIHGRHVRDVLGAEAWEKLRPYMAAALAGETVSYEDEIPYAAAGRRWISATYIPHRVADGTIDGFAVLVNDVSARRHADAALRQSEARHRFLAEALPALVWSNRPDGTSEYFNSRWLTFTGIDLVENGPAGFSQVVHPDDRARVFREWRRALRTGEPYQSEFRLRRVDGCYRWCLARAVPMRDDHGQIVRWFGTCTDIDDRRGAEETLRRSERAHRLLVAVHDATRGRRNPAEVVDEIVVRVARHLGVPRCAYGDIDADQEHFTISRDFADGLPSIAGRYQLADYSAELVRTARQGETLVIRDVEQDPRSAGAPARAFAWLAVRALLLVPLVKEGRLVALFAVADREPRAWSAEDVDVVEQVAERTWFAVENARTETALRESRDVLALAMRGARMGAWWRDIATNRVWWSRELAELFGLPEDGFGGTEDAFFALLHPDDRDAVARAIETALATRDDYAVEFRFRHAGGTWRWMEGRGRAVYGADGRPTRLYGIGIDVTERRLVEEELRRLNEQLSQSDRRKDEFLATLAHELRNPLAPIRSAVELMRLRDPPDATARGARDIIDRQLRHLTRLIDDLLDASRITRGKVELRRTRFALAVALHGAVEAVRPLFASAGHELIVEPPADALEIDADLTRVVQILVNLLNNAAKFTPSGGRIVLRAAREGADAVVRVRDSGIGIPADQLRNIFEMFAQITPALDRSQGGLGIGLALARALVTLHGGTIAARSDGLGHGSEFIVRLPALAAAAASGPALEPSAVAARVAPGRRVLVVDDNRDAADSLSLVLQVMGHEVRTVYDGAQAVDAVPAFAPDVVLLDIGLPNLNGYEVAQLIRARPDGAAILLIAVTGWGQDEDKRRATLAGFDHHLTKPVEPARLAALLAADDSSCVGT